MEINLKNNLSKDILFLMRIKANEFKSEGVNAISVEDIKEYLFYTKWNQSDTIILCDMIDDIMSLKFSDIFEYLKYKVIKEATYMNIEDFSEFIAK